MAQIGGKNVPQELINAIVNYLPNDKESLRSCGLVSRSFTEPSQRRLFYRYELIIDERGLIPIPGERVRVIPVEYMITRHLLKTPLTRTSYARVLHIRIGRCESRLAPYLELIDRLTSLEQVFMSCEVEGNLEPIGDVIRHCCKPTVKRFSITQTTMSPWPWHHIRQCQDLDHLSIYHRLPRTSDLEASDTENPPIPLHSLYLNDLHIAEKITECLRDPRLPFRIDTLTALGIIVATYYSGQLQALQELLPTLQNLRKLAIGPCLSSPGPSIRNPAFTVLDLSRLPRLNALLLSTYEESDTSSMAWIKGQLSTLPSTATVYKLHIVTSVYSRTYNIADLPPLAERWKEVDDTLSESKFNGLRSVVVHIDDWFHHKLRTTTMVGLVENAMPKLKGSKRLTVKGLDPDHRHRDHMHGNARPHGFFSENLFLDFNDDKL